ncbi:MAG: hypothetical protein HY531_03660 [Chloroflexi bacterium]|nr:hypothetical protein [Chloroflexota bacterium]
MLIPAALVVALGAGVPLIFQGGASSSATFPQGVALPAYVRGASLKVKAAYADAIQHASVLQYIPCWCGCGQHSGHTSVHDCFVQYGHLSGGTVAFDEHGANCDMCVELVQDAKRLTEDGQTIRQVRQYATAKYGTYGPATNTPPAP